jgi:hypothetical protein
VIVNQARTLLLNRTGTGFIKRPGEEFIAPTFAKIENLPNYLSGVRTALFGSSSDWLIENYRTRQYMTILHSTELEEFVTALDPRITYDPFDNSMFQGVFGTTVNKTGLKVIGSPPPPDDTGRSDLRWRITSVDGDSTLIKLFTPDTPEVEVAYQQTTPLFDGLSVQFDADPDKFWTVQIRRRPRRSLGAILQTLEFSTAQYWNDLFGVGSARGETEPWKTFRNLWLKNKQLPYRLGGILMAFIYAMEERRLSGGR